MSVSCLPARWRVVFGRGWGVEEGASVVSLGEAGDSSALACVGA